MPGQKSEKNSKWKRAMTSCSHSSERALSSKSSKTSDGLPTFESKLKALPTATINEKLNFPLKFDRESFCLDFSSGPSTGTSDCETKAFSSGKKLRKLKLNKLKLSDAHSMYSLSGEENSGDGMSLDFENNLNLPSPAYVAENFNRKNSLEDDLREAMPSVI